MEENSSNIREVDVGFFINSIRRNWILVAILPLIFGLVAYEISRKSPSIYESSAILLAANNVSNPLAERSSDQAVVNAPPLPEGVMNQAIQSRQVMDGVLKDLMNSQAISDLEKRRLFDRISEEIQDQQIKTAKLSSRLDFNGNGTYTINAQAREPQAARILANLIAQSLVKWDRSRGISSIRSAVGGFDSQLQQISRQLEDGAISAGERQLLLSRQTRIQESKIQLLILEDSAVGVLSPLVEAQLPRQPVSPKPVRNLVLAVFLGLFLGVAVAALVSVIDRTVRTEEDLLQLGLPTLATLPRLRQRDVLLRGIVRAARQAGLYEAVGFLRVNLLTTLANRAHPVVMMTSTAPGEGKSSVTATLADGIASSGQKVLIVDADLRRGTQADVWKKYDETGSWRSLGVSGGARTTSEALLRPHEIEVLQVEPNVDVLPAGAGLTNSLGILNQADIAKALDLWRQHYDIVLVDTAPLLALADGLVIGRHVDAVIMVVEYGQTHVQAAASAIRRANRAGLNIIGSVINKANAREESGYSYGYSYEPKSKRERA